MSADTGYPAGSDLASHFPMCPAPRPASAAQSVFQFPSGF